MQFKLINLGNVKDFPFNKNTFDLIILIIFCICELQNKIHSFTGQISSGLGIFTNYFEIV